MSESVRSATAVLSATLLSMSLTAATTAQSNAQTQQPTTQQRSQQPPSSPGYQQQTPAQGQTQQMQQRNQMQRQDQTQTQQGRTASGASQRDGRLHAPLQVVALLNTLSAEGYVPRGDFERTGNEWRLPAANAKGEPTTITLDRATGQVMAQESGGRTTVVGSIPTSQTGTMSGSPERTQKRR
jgi:hypothetical protein